MCLLQVPAIQLRRIVAYFNQFVVHTVRFVNRFAIVCEEVCACLFSMLFCLSAPAESHKPDILSSLTFYLLSCRNLPTYPCAYSRLRLPFPFWKLRLVLPLVCRFKLFTFLSSACMDPVPNIVMLWVAVLHSWPWGCNSRWTQSHCSVQWTHNCKPEPDRTRYTGRGSRSGEYIYIYIYICLHTHTRIYIYYRKKWVVLKLTFTF